MTDRNFTFVDIETTGGSPFFSRIIEVGILRVEKGEIVDTFNRLINPGVAIPEFITALTGVTGKMVKQAPAFEDVAEDILDLFEDSIFVAHNSNFDYKFMKTEFERAGLVFALDTMCTVRLSRVLYPQYKKHNLTALIERFQFVCKNRHRAFDDAKVLWDFLQRASLDFSGPELEAAIVRTVKKISPKEQRKLAQVLVQELEYVEEG